MDRTWITSARRFSTAYVEGVENFMNFIRAEYGGPKSDVLCPCSSCMNSVTRPQSTVQNHLHLYGMSVTYTRWVHHGEAVNVNVIDYVEAADHHLDLPDAQVEEEEEVVVAEPVSLTNIETILRNAHAFREFHLQKKNGGPACLNNATWLSPQEISCQYSQLWSPFFR